MSSVRQFSWLSQVMQADPEHGRAKRHVIEYEFSAPGGGDDKTHEEGKRVFKANYDTRGPYAEDEE